MNFRGENEINLDDKGRMSIPTKYRQGLADLGGQQMVMAPHPHEKCLLLYPLQIWLEIEATLNEIPNFNDDLARKMQRLFIGKAKDVSMDKSGRVLIAPDFRKRYELDKKITLVGVGKKFEIWRDDLWLALDEDWGIDVAEASETLKNLSI